MTAGANRERDFNPRPVPPHLKAGLDLFAATWLHIWGEYGGSVSFGSDGRMMLGMPDYFDSLDYSEPSADLPESLKSDNQSFAMGSYTGKMRAHMALLESMPFGRDALKQHMRDHGLPYYFGKTKVEDA